MKRFLIGDAWKFLNWLWLKPVTTLFKISYLFFLFFCFRFCQYILAFDTKFKFINISILCEFNKFYKIANRVTFSVNYIHYKIYKHSGLSLSLYLHCHHEVSPLIGYGNTKSASKILWNEELLTVEDDLIIIYFGFIFDFYITHKKLRFQRLLGLLWRSRFDFIDFRCFFFRVLSFPFWKNVKGKNRLVFVNKSCLSLVLGTVL